MSKGHFNKPYELGLLVSENVGLTQDKGEAEGVA